MRDQVEKPFEKVGPSLVYPVTVHFWSANRPTPPQDAIFSESAKARRTLWPRGREPAILSKAEGHMRTPAALIVTHLWNLWPLCLLLALNHAFPHRSASPGGASLL